MASILPGASISLFSPAQISAGDALTDATNTVEINRADVSRLLKLARTDPFFKISHNFKTSRALPKGFQVNIKTLGNGQTTVVEKAQNEAFHKQILELSSELILYRDSISYAVIHYLKPTPLTGALTANLVTGDKPSDKPASTNPLYNLHDAKQRFKIKTKEPRQEPEDQSYLQSTADPEGGSLVISSRSKTRKRSPKNREHDLEEMLDALLTGVNVEEYDGTGADLVDQSEDEELNIPHDESEGLLEEIESNSESKYSGPNYDFEEWVPRVMDPETECTVRFKTGPDGQRHYYACPLNFSTTTAKNASEFSQQSLPNTTVIVFTHPTSLGRILSPLQACEEHLRGLQNGIDLSDIRDNLNTSRPLLYTATSKQDHLIPNISAAPPAVDPPFPIDGPPDRQRQTEQRRLQKALGEMSQGPQWQDIAKAVARFQEEQGSDLHKAAESAAQETLYDKQWNAQLGRYSHVQPINPFGKFLLLPTGVDYAQRDSTYKTDEDLVYKTELKIRIVSATLGFPRSELAAAQSRIAAESNQEEERSNSIIKQLQMELERAVARIYLDVFAPKYIGLMSEMVATYVRRQFVFDQLEILADAVAKATQKVNDLSLLIDQVEELGAKSLLQPKLLRAQQRKRGLEVLFETAKTNRWQAIQDEITFHASMGQQRSASFQSINSELQRLLEKEVSVTVKFLDNSKLTPAEISFLKEIGAVTLNDARRLALYRNDLAETWLPTPEKLLEDARWEAKRQKILNPPPPKPAPGEKPTATNKAESMGSSAATKKQTPTKSDSGSASEDDSEVTAARKRRKAKSDKASAAKKEED